MRELRAFLAARGDATCAHATEKRELADRVRVLQRERAAAEIQSTVRRQQSMGLIKNMKKLETAAIELQAITS